MSVKAEFTFERNTDHQFYTVDREFNDEQHLENYVRKCIRGGANMAKYINHRIIHENDKPLLSLNDAQIIFDAASTSKYKTLRELLLKELKLRI